MINTRLKSRVALGLLATTALALIAPATGRAESTLRLLPVRGLDEEAGEFSLVRLKLTPHPPAKQTTLQRFVGGAPVTAPSSAVHVLRASANPAVRKKSSTDIQISSAAFDHTQTFDGVFPFEFATQSETTICSDGNHIVASFNTSAGAEVVEFMGDLFYSQLLLSGYSVSHDAGKTWKSGFVPPAQNSIATFGDGVLAKDRQGNFYYAGLGLDENFEFGITINKSTDHGETFGPATIIALDEGGDKEWVAIGPDPKLPARDNIYLTWTRFTDTGSILLFSRSTDGGVTWSTPRTIYTPADDGLALAPVLQFSNPTVDASNGRLYIPFLHAGYTDADYIRMLVSDDGGTTFKEAKFNVSGAPDAQTFPVVSPGLIADCGDAGGIRVVVKQGPDIGGGVWGNLFGLPRFVNCTRLVTQPAAAADRGRVVLALNRSTSPYISDPAAGSEIVLLYSGDSGATWNFSSTVPSTASSPAHFHPAVSLAKNGNSVCVGYYVQQANEQVRTELSVFGIDTKKASLRAVYPLSSVAFDLPPNNIPDPNDTETTINFDQLLSPGYSLGEYMGIAVDDSGNALSVWGDSRQSWNSPANGYFPGTHAQADVFFRKTAVK